jgi:hypothetical protein
LFDLGSDNFLVGSMFRGRHVVLIGRDDDCHDDSDQRKDQNRNNDGVCHLFLDAEQRPLRYEKYPKRFFRSRNQFRDIPFSPIEHFWLAKAD